MNIYMTVWANWCFFKIIAIIIISHRKWEAWAAKCATISYSDVFVTLRFLNYKIDLLMALLILSVFFKDHKIFNETLFVLSEKAPSGFTKLMPEGGFTSFFKIHP